jgi:hypothetical protein
MDFLSNPMLEGFRVDYRGPRGGFTKDIRDADRFTVYLPDERIEVYLGNIKNFSDYRSRIGLEKFKIILRDRDGEQVSLKSAKALLTRYENSSATGKKRIRLYRVFLVIPKGTKTVTIPFSDIKKSKITRRKKSKKKSKRQVTIKSRQNFILKFLKEATYSVDIRRPKKQPKKKIPDQVFPGFKLNLKETVIRKIIKSKEDGNYKGIEKHFYDMKNSMAFVEKKNVRGDLIGVFKDEMKEKMKALYKKKGQTDYFMKIMYEAQDVKETATMKKKNQQFTGFALPRLLRGDVSSWDFLDDQIDIMFESLEDSIKNYIRNNMAGMFYIKGFQVEATEK